MLKPDKWRKALLTSVLFHCLMLTGVGWLGGMFFTSAHPPDFMEMELVSVTDRPERAANPGSSHVVPAKGMPAPAPAPASVPAPMPVRSAVAEKAAAVAEIFGDTVGENSTVQAGNGAAATGGSLAAGTAGGELAAGTAASSDAPAGGKTIAAPRLLHKTEPQYPEEERRAGIEGTVAVKIEIQENGEPGEISIVRSSGRAAFDEAAVQAVRTWRFVPAQEVESGRPVRCYTMVSIVFQLKV